MFLAREGPLCCSLLFERWRLDDLDGGDTHAYSTWILTGILLAICTTVTIECSTAMQATECTRDV